MTIAPRRPLALTKKSRTNVQRRLTMNCFVSLPVLLVMLVKVNGQEQGNVVVYSGVTYSKDYTDGQWFKFAASDTAKPETVDLKKEFLKSDFKNDSGQNLTYKNLGTEQCGVLKCHKYQETDPAKLTETTYLLFDTKDFLLRRVTANDSKANT